jgi:hypothetical protein
MEKTVVALMLDDQQPWIGHVNAYTNEDAANKAQRLYYTTLYLTDPEAYPALPDGFVPNVLQVLVVLDGHAYGACAGQDFDVRPLYQQGTTRNFLLANPFVDRANLLEWMLSSAPTEYVPAWSPLEMSPTELAVEVFGNVLSRTPLQLVGLTSEGVDLRGNVSSVETLRHTTILPYHFLTEPALRWCLKLLADHEENKVE